MRTALVVVRPFGSHAVGDVITDEGEGDRVLAGEHADSVVRVPHDFTQPQVVPAGAGGED